MGVPPTMAIKSEIKQLISNELSIGGLTNVVFFTVVI